MASSEAVQTGWSGVNGHRNADGQDSDGSNETLMSDHQRAQQKPATGIMAGGGSPGYHFPGALLPTKRVPHKVTLILDLDETLVHSSFKPVPGADWVVRPWPALLLLFFFRGRFSEAVAAVDCHDGNSLPIC